MRLICIEIQLYLNLLYYNLINVLNNIHLFITRLQDILY